MTAEEIWTSVLLGLVTGVISGLLASAIYVGLARRLRPKFELSTQIARAVPNGPGALPFPYEYRIKIVNKRRRAALDVRLAVFISEGILVPRGPSNPGKVDHLEPLSFTQSEFPVISPRKRKDADHRHALRVRINADLADVWTDARHQAILVRITARDEKSGMFYQTEQRYHTTSAITDGTFCNGDSMEIV